MVHYQYTKNEEQMWVEVKLLIGQHATWLDVAKAIVSDPFSEVHLPGHFPCPLLFKCTIT